MRTEHNKETTGLYGIGRFLDVLRKLLIFYHSKHNKRSRLERLLSFLVALFPAMVPYPLQDIDIKYRIVRYAF